MTDRKTDVLVVGARPVGLTMASEMARYGLSVRTVDKNAERTDKSKALVLWPRTLELMGRMGAGCTALHRRRPQSCWGQHSFGT